MDGWIGEWVGLNMQWLCWIGPDQYSSDQAGVIIGGLLVLVPSFSGHDFLFPPCHGVEVGSQVEGFVRGVPSWQEAVLDLSCVTSDPSYQDLPDKVRSVVTVCHLLAELLKTFHPAPVWQPPAGM